MKKEAFNYYVAINGLFGRNRKVKTDTFDLAKNQDSPLPEGTVLELAEAQIRKLKPKGIYAIKVAEQPVTIEDMGNGFTCTSYRLFSDRTILSERRGDSATA